MKGGFCLIFLVGKMPILRGLMPLKINDYRKYRKIKENRKNTHAEWAFVEH